jgi:hypothetical protein
MRNLLIALLVTVLLVPAAAQSVTHNKSKSYSVSAIAIDLDTPAGTVYQAGDEVAFSLQTNRDGYVVVFDIDTEGFVHLLYPRDGKILRKISSRQTYAVPEQQDETLFVTGSTGMEFVFAMLVPKRTYFKEEQLSFLADNEKLPVEKKFRIDGDPFLAANMIARSLVRDPYTVDVSLAYTYFFINKGVDYPRYLCLSCETEGRDPYGEDLGFALEADLEDRAGLAYPLDVGFQTAGRDVGEGAYGVEAYDYAAEESDDDNSTEVTRVYVSYYPVWSDGFYYRPWHRTYFSSYWYYDSWFDPWYFSWGYPYYPYHSGFHIGFGWGHGWPYHYYPYYFSGHDRHHRYRHGDFAHRGLRHHEGYRYKSTLHTAMNHRADRAKVQTRSLRYKDASRLAKRTTRSYTTKGRYGTKRSVGNVYRPDGFRSKHKRASVATKRIQPRRLGERTTYRIQKKSYRTRSVAKKGLRSDRTRDYRKKRPVRQFRSSDLRSRSSRAKTHSLRRSSAFSKSRSSSAVKRTVGKRSSRSFTRSKSSQRSQSRSSFTRQSTRSRSSHSKGTRSSTRRGRSRR